MSEDQIICGHKQECGHDPDMDCTVYLFTSGFHQVSVRVEEKHATDFTLLQLNLFEKRDLMALLRGDSPRNNQLDIDQMVLL